ncbi:hypothetical protein MKK69_13760 [Methylobacterium sp. J-026]|uniref:hypothetical protein n=1 Tax=Methylobacterium sp. J-026 TaxID=2836624 RepID=UPI001FB98E4E|nr:hypothetical protein [Methylobacterium sp. J-026]MCJ2135111.1 hypothetical protein [Methylobacterium sp. J-026]
MIPIVTRAEEQAKNPDPARGTDIDTKTEASAIKPTPALIVFGADKDGKPHASWFAEPDTSLATKAAGVMNMRALPLSTEAHQNIATELPQGRVFSSGRAFVPFVKKGVYDRLSVLAGPAEVTASINPAPGAAVALTSAAATSDVGDQTPKAPSSGEARYPRSWVGVVVGSLVLITEGEQDGWYEAEVIEAKAGGIFSLRWRDWPDLPLLVRRREHMALLHPNTAAIEVA